jgi:hypothetical protein
VTNLVTVQPFKRYLWDILSSSSNIT